MYHVRAQGVDERMINVHYYHYYTQRQTDRQKHTHRQRQRDRERQGQRHRDRQTDKQAFKGNGREKEGATGIERQRHRDRQTDMQTDGEQSFALLCIAFVKQIHSPEERRGSTGGGPIETTQDVKGRKQAKEGQVETGREQVCLRRFAFRTRMHA